MLQIAGQKPAQVVALSRAADLQLSWQTAPEKQTGDVTRHPVDLQPITVETDSYWTAHFGGLYLFRDVEHPALISVSDPPAVKGIETFAMAERNRMAAFFDLNHLVEHITPAIQAGSDEDPDTVARRNARLQAERLTSESAILREAVANDGLRIVTGFYDLETGSVELG